MGECPEGSALMTTRERRTSCPGNQKDPAVRTPGPFVKPEQPLNIKYTVFVTRQLPAATPPRHPANPLVYFRSQLANGLRHVLRATLQTRGALHHLLAQRIVGHLGRRLPYVLRQFQQRRRCLIQFPDQRHRRIGHRSGSLPRAGYRKRSIGPTRCAHESSSCRPPATRLNCRSTPSRHPWVVSLAASNSASASVRRPSASPTSSQILGRCGSSGAASFR